MGKLITRKVYLCGAVAEAVRDVAHHAGEVHVGEIGDARAEVGHETQRVAQKVHRSEDAQRLGPQLQLEVEAHLVPQEPTQLQAVPTLKFTCTHKKGVVNKVNGLSWLSS